MAEEYSSVDEGMDVGTGVSDQLGCTSVFAGIITATGIITFILAKTADLLI